MSRDFVSARDGGTLVRLRVSPGAKATALQGLYGEESLRLRVAAPPVDGRANAEVERFLAGLFGVARTGVEVVRGLAMRDKTVYLDGVDAAEAREVLSPRPR